MPTAVLQLARIPPSAITDALVTKRVDRLQLARIPPSAITGSDYGNARW